MPWKATQQYSDSHNPVAPHDTPLYAIFENGEWYYVDEEIWTDHIIRSQEFAFTCETCGQQLANCLCDQDA